MAELHQFPSAIADRDERAEALDTGRSFIVEAPAGSGKTGLLIQRFLKLLATENVTQPAQVLAITFTRKATAEMRERVLGQLQKARDGATPANAFDEATRPLAEAVLVRDLERGWKLLENPGRLNIRTIDSVCADLAGSLPVLSGAGSGASPVDDAWPLYEEAAHRTLMLLGGDDQRLSRALEDVLLHRDGNLAESRELVARMLSWRDQWAELIPLAPSQLTDDYLDKEVLPRLDRALDVAVCRSLTELTRLLAPSGVLSRLSALAAEMAQSDGYPAGNASPLAVCAGRHMPPEEKAAHLDHWNELIGLLVTKSGTFRAPRGVTRQYLKLELADHHKQELVSIIDQLRPNEALRDLLCRISSLPPAEYPREQWPTAKSVFRVLSQALVQLQLVFAARGQCDFTETALQARSALGREEALTALNATLDLQHLLVDEMQDTSSAQYELIQLLTQSWDGYSQTVFLVGDPKQSIYLFRQARVERFVQTMLRQTLGMLPVKALHLTTNFRSQSGLVNAFNQTFAGMFPAELDATQPEIVPYRAATANRPSTQAAGQVWHAAVLPYSDDRAACAAARQAQGRADAQQIRDVVMKWRASASSGKPPSMAVLVRNRTHLLEVIAAFRQQPAVPYRAVKIEPLAERREILDLLALTRALLHPADRTAWLALLRSPWCGLSLRDLHALTGADDRMYRRDPVARLIRDRADELSDDGRARLHPFWLIMQHALTARAERPLARVIELAWRALGGHATGSAEERSNCTRFFSKLEELEAAGTLTAALLTQHLQQLYAQPANVPGAIDLMTIHGAKGLEWDVVFLPALERRGASNGGRLLSWLETEGANPTSGADVAPGILAPMTSKGGETEKLNQWIAAVGNAREAAERSRLFYVACTRAREELHLFGSVQEKADGSLVKPVSGSLLSAAWAVAEEQFLETQRVQQADAEPVLLQMAAAAAQDSAHDSALDVSRLIDRVPAHLLQTAPAVSSLRGAPSTLVRPEGSVAARAFGNTLHTLLEQLGRRVAAEDPIIASAVLAGLSAEVPGWRPRVLALLRQAGLPAGRLAEDPETILRALVATLAAPAGRWLLLPHAEARSEQAFAVRTVKEGRESIQTLRLDRTFLAGAEPLSTGTSHRWIVDYKTTTPDGESLEAFFAKQEQLYRPQLEGYAAHFLGATGGENIVPVRLALFFPLLASLRVLDGS